MIPAENARSASSAAFVLLVEDEPIIRALLAEELRTVGLTVIEASNADEAWSYLEAGGEVNLIFSDIAMPGKMNGADLMCRVKAAYPEIKRILTSANPGPGNVTELGRFLPKPYRLETASRLTLSLLGIKSHE